jgi:hypothetical protein
MDSNAPKRRRDMYDVKFKLTVLASGCSKLFTTREAAERWAGLVLGLKREAYKIDTVK